MKTLFPGFYKPSDSEFNTLWKEGTVVFDTNVLFDVYRVSDETAKALINTIKYYSEDNRLFIPYRVAFEYHRKLLSVIQGQKKNYDEAFGHLKTFQSKLREKRSHPFLSDKLNLLAELKNRLKISIFLWRKKLCISLIFSNFVVSNYKVIYFTLCTTCMQIS